MAYYDIVLLCTECISHLTLMAFLLGISGDPVRSSSTCTGKGQWDSIT